MKLSRRLKFGLAAIVAIPITSGILNITTQNTVEEPFGSVYQQVLKARFGRVSFKSEGLTYSFQANNLVIDFERGAYKELDVTVSSGSSETFIKDYGVNGIDVNDFVDFNRRRLLGDVLTISGKNGQIRDLQDSEKEEAKKLYSQAIQKFLEYKGGKK